MRTNPIRERPPEFWIPRASRFFTEFEEFFDAGVRGAETRRHGREYLTSLLLPLPEEVRKNAENLAARFPIPPHRFHQFLAYSSWDHRPVQERLVSSRNSRPGLSRNSGPTPLSHGGGSRRGSP